MCKKKFPVIIGAALMLTLWGCESGTKITGTLAGENAADFSEVEVYISSEAEYHQLLKAPASVNDGKFTLKLPPVPPEMTVPWKNRNNIEHVRTAEADVVAKKNTRPISIGLYGSKEAYKYIYADRDANMEGWSTNMSSNFFNWTIADWWQQFDIKVEWEGVLKKGWNIVRFSCSRNLFKKYSATAKVQVLPPENAVWQTRDAVGLKPPPTGEFSGKIAAVSKYKTLYMGYSSQYYSYLSRENIWSVPTTDDKCSFTLPDPPQSEMGSYAALRRLFYNGGWSMSSGFDVSASENYVKLADIGFFLHPEGNYGQYPSLTPYYDGKEVIFVYSTGDLIVQGGSGTSEIKHYELNFKRGWNTVLHRIDDSGRYHTFETAKINGEIEFKK